MLNKGYINNLPQSIVVEVPAVIDKSGIHGVGVGSLPKAIANLCNTQELAVEAAFEGSYEKTLQALLIDPVVHNLEAAKVTLMNYSEHTRLCYHSSSGENIKIALSSIIF